MVGFFLFYIFNTIPTQQDFNIISTIKLLAFIISLIYFIYLIL